MLETADYWLSIGATLGLRRPVDTRRLLEMIVPDDAARAEPEADTNQFVQEALR